VQTDQPQLLFVTWQGAQFRIADKVALMPLLEFSHLAQEGVDSVDMEAMAAMYDVIKSCVADNEWLRFKQHAIKVRADDQDMLDFVKRTFEVLSDRPTKQPSDSSDGLQATKQSSTEDLSSRVLSRLGGRPDLQLAVIKAQENQNQAGTG
jgi:hypothetical protein